LFLQKKPERQISLASDALQQEPILQIKFRTEIDLAGFGVVDQKFPVAGADDFAFVDQIGAVHQLESFTHVVVGD